MSKSRYKWSSPNDWALSKAIEDAYVHGAGGSWLLTAFQAIVMLADPDQIQDLFQREMDEDGYFDAEPE